MANKENAPPALAARDSSQNKAYAAIFGKDCTALEPQSWQGLVLTATSPGFQSVQRCETSNQNLRKANSPLRVRKTRENLRQADIQREVSFNSPSFSQRMSHETYDAARGTATSDASKRERSSFGENVSNVISDDGAESALQHGETKNANRTLRPPTSSLRASSGPQRQKSISRRVLSKVKEGINNKARNSSSSRASGPETGLLRQLSAKAEQPMILEKRAYSFEVSRECAERFADQPPSDSPDPSSKRYFTDSTVSIKSPILERGISTPSSRKSGAMSGRLTSQVKTDSPAPNEESSRRPSNTKTSRSLADFAPLHSGGIPSVRLQVSVDRSSLDVELEGQIWVAIEAIVQSGRDEVTLGTHPRTLYSKHTASFDAVLLVATDFLSDADAVARQCLIELFSKLDASGDRVAVICFEQCGTSTNPLDSLCTVAHPLHQPRPSILFNRLGVYLQNIGRPSTEAAQPLRYVLSRLAEHSLHSNEMHAFVISETPRDLAEQIGEALACTTHQIKVGRHQDKPLLFSSPRPLRGWITEFHDPDDIEPNAFDTMITDIRRGGSVGSITSLRLCFKPLSGCRILEVIGQKACKDMQLGQKCSLFLKVHVPVLHPSHTPTTHKNDQEMLFNDLASMMGALEANLLHVEARYRHSLLPTASVVSVRHFCSIKRPRSDSRWCLDELHSDMASAKYVHQRLADYIAMHYTPCRALTMLNGCVSHHSLSSDTFQRVQRFLTEQVKRERRDSLLQDDTAPMAHQGMISSTPRVRNDYTDPSSRAGPRRTSEATASTSKLADSRQGAARQISSKFAFSPPSASLGTLPPLNSAISPTRSMPLLNTLKELPPEPPLPSPEADAADAARQVWRHIRRSSLSSKQLMDMAPDQVHAIEAGDDRLKAMRLTALANKRSVGVETLRAWK